MAKTNGGAGRFLEGTVIGVALGVAASVFFNSKKGKEIEKDAEHMMADFYKSVSPKIKKIKKMGEKEYKMFMKEAAEKYIKAKKVPEDMAKDFIRNAEQTWKHFSKHLGK
jgi:gas vesicle protein